MPAPIPFSVAAAQRSGTFSTNNITYPGGYTSCTWQLTGMGTGAGSDYEKAGNKFTATLLYDPTGGTNFQVFDQATWNSGHVVLNGVTDPTPTLQFQIGNLPTGSTVQVQIALTGTFTIGISNGLIQ